MPCHRGDCAGKSSNPAYPCHVTLRPWSVRINAELEQFSVYPGRTPKRVCDLISWIRQRMFAGTDSGPTPKRLPSNVPAGTMLFFFRCCWEGSAGNYDACSRTLRPAGDLSVVLSPMYCRTK